MHGNFCFWFLQLTSHVGWIPWWQYWGLQVCSKAVHHKDKLSFSYWNLVLGWKRRAIKVAPFPILFHGWKEVILVFVKFSDAVNIYIHTHSHLHIPHISLPIYVFFTFCSCGRDNAETCASSYFDTTNWNIAMSKIALKTVGGRRLTENKICHALFLLLVLICRK